MKPISSLGKGLTLIVVCDYLPHHNWMTFACWYSIQKNLPDANVVIACKRGMYSSVLFSWPWKTKAKFFQFSEDYDPIKISLNRELHSADNFVKRIENPAFMAVRGWHDFEITPAKEEREATFVSYDGGCGKFVMDRWINRLKPPFGGAVENFLSEKVTTNEMRVLKLWERMKNIYDVL